MIVVMLWRYIQLLCRCRSPPKIQSLGAVIGQGISDRSFALSHQPIPEGVVRAGSPLRMCVKSEVMRKT